MHNHKHEHCYHDLRYCSICDEVYCQKCSKEWQKKYFWANSTLGNWKYTNASNVALANMTNNHSHLETTNTTENKGQ